MYFRYLLPLLALFFVAGAKKPELTIRFHLQANPQDGSSFVMQLPLANAPAPVFVKKVPEISERDIVAIYPFPAGDGSYGCALKLDNHGRIALDAVSVEERGRVIVCMVNLRLVTAIMIDKRVSDGILTIPSGLSEKDIALMETKYRMIGQPQGKPRKRR